MFPVYGATSYIDTFGAKRADVTYHHGDDIFGSLGQPLVACTDGIVFSVGFNKIGGNRLWIVDKAGNQFYYAHLSAFAINAVNGAHVKAGQVIGFMGNTGDAEGTPVHLHFEIRPVSFLYLGYDGAVAPTPYLDAWQHQQDLPFPTAGGGIPPFPVIGPAAPEPGGRARPGAELPDLVAQTPPFDDGKSSPKSSPPPVSMSFSQRRGSGPVTGWNRMPSAMPATSRPVWLLLWLFRPCRRSAALRRASIAVRSFSRTASSVATRCASVTAPRPPTSSV